MMIVTPESIFNKSIYHYLLLVINRYCYLMDNFTNLYLNWKLILKSTVSLVDQEN